MAPLKSIAMLFIVSLESIHNKNICFIEQKCILNTKVRLKHKKSLNWHAFVIKKLLFIVSELPPIGLYVLYKLLPFHYQSKDFLPVYSSK
jgi:hypothetical protein